MSYQDEELIKQKRIASRQAITLAMEGRWSEAVTANQEIIKDFPNDLEAYNRLGRAQMETGQYSQARQAYQKALELEPYNAIAERNLKRLEHLKEKDNKTRVSAVQKVEPHIFIEEIGQAGIAELEKLAPQEILAKVDAGDKLKLETKGSDLIIKDDEGVYLGKVDVTTGRRLIKLLEGGNRYSATAISSAEDKLTIILREVFQHPSQEGRLSFPARGSLTLKPYTSETDLGLDESELHIGGDEDIIDDDEEEDIIDLVKENDD